MSLKSPGSSAEWREPGRRKNLEWWAMMAAAFALGGVIGWLLI
jgi:hypothetical protein